jgi:hypothetical protein
MDTPASDLVGTAVDLMAQAASGAAGTIGSSAATTALALVRERLQATERGRAVLARFEASPQEPENAQVLRLVLSEETAADREFERRLAEAVAGASHTYTGSVVISGGSVKRSTVTLGPVTINNSRGGRFMLAAFAAALVALVALAAYGTQQLIVTDGSESATPDASQPSLAGDSTASSPAADDDGEDDATADIPTPATTAPELKVAGGCFEDYSEEKNLVGDHPLPLGETVENIAGLYDRPAALRLLVNDEPVGLLSLSYELSLGFHAHGLVDAYCQKVPVSSADAPGGGMLVAMELEGTEYEVAVGASFGTMVVEFRTL